MFDRLLEPILTKTSKNFPVVVLTGPRQSGKTTLLQKLFPDFHYVNLEAPDRLLDAKNDPRGFLNARQGHCIIDEAQHYPEIFSYIQEYVDRINKPGQFILSGSQNFLLAEKISQTLAGRSVILELLPLTYSEYLTNTAKPISLWEYLFYGSYPRPYHEHLDTKLWYQSYIRTYLERDVRSIVGVKDLSRFQLFLKLCAGRHGQLLNLSALAQDCGISHTTASQWIGVLEASYIVYRLQPYHRNFKKRMVKTPKLYFYDSAIVAMLLGIESPTHLMMHANRGMIFEGFIISEIIKLFKSKGESAPIYFWRDRAGLEIDLVIEKADGILAFEIKSGATVAPGFISGLSKWQKIAGVKAEQCFVVYAGETKEKRHNINILRWHELDGLFS